MNQNLTYAYGAPAEHRSSGPQNGQQQQGGSFNYSTFHPTSTYTTTSAIPFQTHGGGSFIPNGLTIGSSQSDQNQGGSQVRLMTSQGDGGERYVQLPAPAQDDKIAALLDSYFIDQNSQGGGSAWVPAPSQQQPGTSGGQQMQYGTPNIVSVKTKMSPEKGDKEKVKRAKQAEAARLRYHRLTPEEKRELNLKRTLAQKRKRQREKEMEQLEEILRQSNDIQEDPDITEQLREKRMRAKWAEAARARYQRMTPEERRAHNNRRRMRQMQNALAATKAAGELTGDPVKDEEAIKRHIKMANAKKAEAARNRYHRMSEEEKRLYNQRRTEAFRRRRMEEEMLLAMPIGRINGEALDRAQQIVVRNAKRAEAARLRYQRMTPDQRKMYNQKRYTPKRGMSGKRDMMGMESGLSALPKKIQMDDFDVLSTLERDVVKRTQQAQQALLRQQRTQQQQQGPQAVQVSQGGQQQPSNTTYIIQQGSQAQQMGSHQQVQQLVPGHQVQSVSSSMGNQGGVNHPGGQVQQNIIHTQSQQQHQQQQQNQSSQPTATLIQHQNGQQISYTTNGGMMVTGQQLHQQIINNPYGAPPPRA